MPVATPEEFFTQFALRAFEDFRNSPADEYLAKTAVHHANVLAERMWHQYQSCEPARVFEAKSPSSFRELLSERECPDFALIRDVDDGFKHLVLDRKSRRVTSAGQVGFEPTVWDQTPWDRRKWDGQITIKTDDGLALDLFGALSQVIAM